MDEMEKKVMNTYACRVTNEVRNQLVELMETGKFSTQNQMIETLVEAYLNPKREKSKVAEITSKYEQLIADYEKLNNCRTELETVNNSNKELVNKLTAELEDAKSKVPAQNTMIIPVTKFHRKVLQSLCLRENTKRKRTDLTPEIFVMFVIEEMLVNANVFTIDVLSNSELSRIKRELKEEEKEEW